MKEFVSLDLFFLLIVSIFIFFTGFYFIIMDLIYFIEWENVNIKHCYLFSRSIVLP